jgi:hypothetical protein
VVNELVLGVNIILGNATLEECLAMDKLSDGRVTIDDLVAAVGASLHGCT